MKTKQSKKIYFIFFDKYIMFFNTASLFVYYRTLAPHFVASLLTVVDAGCSERFSLEQLLEFIRIPRVASSFLKAVPCEFADGLRPCLTLLVPIHFYPASRMNPPTNVRIPNNWGRSPIRRKFMPPEFVGTLVEFLDHRT
jgi:hypothetical protein